MRTKNEALFTAITDYIRQYTLANGCPPTIQMIADATGMSKSNAARYLKEMKERGSLADTGRIGAVTTEVVETITKLVRVPILGPVSCGIPKLAEENIEEYVSLPSSLFGNGSFYLLRANGDSMIEAGIDDGDLVLIRQQNTAHIGQIVVALMEDEATLKRFYPEPENRRIRLHPENSTMEDIYVSDCIIQGVAVKVLKDLD